MAVPRRSVLGLLPDHGRRRRGLPVRPQHAALPWAGLAAVFGGAGAVAGMFVVEGHPKTEWNTRISWFHVAYGPTHQSREAPLREALFMAANAARRTDPTLAARYHRLMVHQGKHHNSALCHISTTL